MKKIEGIRRARKDYSITGDIIVGFPGETEEDFNETLRLVAEVGL
jgi:tRNA-2-methylthio-N6-dimethylallyladenosine synthase